MPAISSILAGIALGIGAAGTGYTIAAGEDAKNKQAAALQTQETSLPYQQSDQIHQSIFQKK